MINNTLIIKFYDYYGQVYNQQTLNVQAEYIMDNLSLNELVALGVVIPTLPDVYNKSFLEWIQYPTKYDENNNNTIVYSFWSKYINTSLGTEYCDNQLDDLEDEINNHDNNMNLHIDEQNNMINNADTTIGNLNNIDGDITDEIRIVEEGYNKNLQKILLLNNREYDKQFSYLYSDIQEVQDEITYMGINHIEELYGISQQLNTNESRMTNLQNKIYSIPKHYIISQNEYNNLVSKDKNAIYFTKEQK